MNVQPSVAAESAAAPDTFGARAKAFKERHHLAFEVAFFFAGFLFDVVLLHRIDSTPLLMHQATYLLLSALLIFWDHRLAVVGQEPAGLLGKIASYRLWAMHFFLGTLLNAFLVFYFRASSGFFAFVFIVLLALVIVANELPRFRQQGPVVRVALLSFSTTSFLAYLLPVLWGELRSWQYVMSIAFGTAVTFGLWRLFTRYTRDPGWTFRRGLLPGLLVQATLLTLYVVDAIPPVPLSIKHIGIYTSVIPERTDGVLHYRLTYQRAPRWRFWQLEHDEIVTAPGERAWAFVRIFAPARFRDQVEFSWEYDDPVHGWTTRGARYRSSLSGGNEEGYRTFAYSTLSKPGHYRVRVLTEDGREIGRKTFRFREGEAPESVEELD